MYRRAWPIAARAHAAGATPHAGRVDCNCAGRPRPRSGVSTRIGPGGQVGEDHMKPNVRILADAPAVAQAGAELFRQLCQQVLSDHDRVCVALSGGKTPIELYRLLASPLYRERIEWPRVEILFIDERCVAPDHADSNYRMA